MTPGKTGFQPVAPGFQPSARPRFRAAELLLTLTGTLLTATIILLGTLEHAVRTAPLPPDTAPPATPVLLDRAGTPFARPGTDLIRDARPLPLHELGTWLPAATIAIEDHRFRTHHGVDWHATAGAALRNTRNLRVISGASTITQQLVKILTHRTERTHLVKAREVLAALHLERVWTKDRILATYLNTIDYGNRRFGAEAAAQAYFDKPAAALTLAESIYLAGLPQSPTRLNPWQHPDAALARYRLNVTRLAADHLLPPDADPETLRNNPPTLHQTYPDTTAPHFTNLVLAASNPHQPSILTTTLSATTQRVAETLLHEHLRQHAALGISDAAVVIIDNATGEVRALACDGRPEHAAINSAATPRSSGSVLKPFIYLAAIEQHLITAATLLPDTPDIIRDTYADYDPQNYDHRSYGPVRARAALGNSLNVPAVHVVSLLGARPAFNSLRDWGFQFRKNYDAYGAGFILGNADIRLLDLAAAYAGIARGGLAWPARLRPTDPITSQRLASPAAAAIVTDILCDNEARRLSFGLNSPLDLGVRVAVKTGTSSGFRDRWCVGFTRDHTIAVWAGNLDGSTLGETLAVRAAGPLWSALTRYLLDHGDQPVPPLQPSENLTVTLIDTTTGLLPRPEDDTRTEHFLPSTEPTESSATMHATIDGRDRLILPAEYATWCASPQNDLAALTLPTELEILYPRPDTTFVLNPHLPRDQQSLAPQSNLPGTTWTLNDTPLETATIPLTPGTHRLTAKRSDESTTTTYTVE